MQAVAAGFAKSHIRIQFKKKKNPSAAHCTYPLIVYARNVRIRSARMPGFLVILLNYSIFNWIKTHSHWRKTHVQPQWATVKNANEGSEFLKNI